MKMLATSAVYADEILIGNLTPIDDKLKSEAITAALPLNAPGLSLWSRQPYAQHVAHRGRLPDVVSFRRDRQRTGLRPRENSVGARVPAQRRRHVAAHLHRDAGELLPEPPVEHPVLGQDAAFASGLNGGLVVTGSALGIVHRKLITTLAARHKLPAVYSGRYYVTVGGLISYGPDLVDQYRRAADYVDRIFKGEKPADLAVQAPTKYELVINLKTAKALGLVMPPAVLGRADEIIE